MTTVVDQYSNPIRPLTKDDVVEIARGWIGTPYKHQSCLKGVGADCLGLLRGVWREIYDADSETPPNYSPAWAEMSPSGAEPMLDASHRHLLPLPLESRMPGDVVLIRVRRRSPVKHCGIVSYDNKVIHAYDNHCVAEEELHVNWKARDMYAFAFPGVDD